MTPRLPLLVTVALLILAVTSLSMMLTPKEPATAAVPAPPPPRPVARMSGVPVAWTTSRATFWVPPVTLASVLWLMRFTATPAPTAAVPAPAATVALEMMDELFSAPTDTLAVFAAALSISVSFSPAWTCLLISDAAAAPWTAVFPEPPAATATVTILAVSLALAAIRALSAVVIAA